MKRTQDKMMEGIKKELTDLTIFIKNETSTGDKQRNIMEEPET